MPSALIHVYAGKLYDPDAGTPFFIGTLAPDCIREREQKDILHLRLSDDRLGGLAGLLREWGTSDPFRAGALMHLYTDYLWDIGPMENHKHSYRGDTWFVDYRHEISLASCYMYHRFDWAPGLWEQMAACPEEEYSSLSDYPAKKIKSYLDYNYMWLDTHDEGPSPAFPPDMVTEFCRTAAESFAGFVKREA